MKAHFLMDVMILKRIVTDKGNFKVGKVVNIPDNHPYLQQWLQDGFVENLNKPTFSNAAPSENPEGDEDHSKVLTFDGIVAEQQGGPVPEDTGKLIPPPSKKNRKSDANPAQ